MVGGISETGKIIVCIILIIVLVFVWTILLETMNRFFINGDVKVVKKKKIKQLKSDDKVVVSASNNKYELKQLKLLEKEEKKKQKAIKKEEKRKAKEEAKKEETKEETKESVKVYEKGLTKTREN